MVVTDQINALRALGTDPVRKLVVPRVLAGFFMTPVLTVISDTVGILGGWLIAVYQLRVASSLYWTSITEALYLQDAWMGIIKPFFLGYVIVTIGCHVGLRTSGGTQGVGRSTTSAVVAASVAVIAVDFFITRLLVYAVVLMATSSIRDAPALERRSAPERPAVVFDKVSLAVRRQGRAEGSELYVAARSHEDHPRRQRLGKSTILKLILGSGGRTAAKSGCTDRASTTCPKST